MGYYTRVFCLSEEKPKIKGILENLKSKGFNVTINLETELTDDWLYFDLNYNDNKNPLLIELNEKEKSNGLVEAEIKEFLELIGTPKPLEWKKRKVIKHLNETNFIICIQIPTNIEDLGFDVNDELMQYISVNFSGIVQADGEGFYKNDKLFVEL